MDVCGDKMTEDGGHEMSGGGQGASTSGPGWGEAVDYPPPPGVEVAKLLLAQVAEVGRGLANMNLGRRKMINPEEVLRRKLLQAEEARVELNRLVTELRKCVSSEKPEEDNDTVNPFPEEVWEKIVGNLGDSRDIENVLRAYPELDGHVMKNKYVWLIDQVVPHVFPWLGVKDVLACRQVCKRWNNGVDNFLEHHPEKRVYNFGSPLTGQVWLPEASRAYYEFRKKFRGVKPFYHRAEIEKFQQSMITHPPGRNVFVGRSATFKPDDNGPILDRPFRAYWNDAIELLRTFGEHLWFIEIYGGERYEFFGQLCDFVFELLSLLPNLKSFHMPGLKILRFAREAMERMELSLRSFPQLPQLETISMPCSGCAYPNVPDCLIKFLVLSSSSTLRRLRLCPCHCKWMVRGAAPAELPSLTEFALLKCTERRIVPVILQSLGAPKLGSLEVELLRDEVKLQRDNVSFLEGNEIVSWATHFRDLHSLKLSVFESAYYFAGDGNIIQGYDLANVYPDELKMDYSRPSCRSSNSLPSLTDSVASLTSLTFENCYSGMEFNFLKCLPNLEYLKIHCSHLPHYFKLEVLCGTGLWEMLHKLKEMTLSYNIHNTYGQSVKSRFFRSREEYLWLKQKIPDSIPEGLFEDSDSLIVRLEQARHLSSSDAAPRDLLLTNGGEYTVGCIQVGVYPLTQANIFNGEADWSDILSWVDALNFLRKYGDHVKRLDFRNQLAWKIEEFYRLTFEVLSLLPNLKALEMWGFTGSGSGLPAAQEFKLLLGQPHVPNLHRLETLKIHGSGLGEALVPPGIVKFLVLNCAETLKKLEVHHCDWVRIKDFEELPSLVELNMDWFTKKSQVNEAFLSFTAPNLIKLDFFLRKDHDEPVGGSDIISWLKFFPKLETCRLWIWDKFSESWPNQKWDEVKKKTIRECEVSSPASVSLPSLKSFQLKGCPNPYELSLNFLHSFPNLEELELSAEYHHPYFSEVHLGGPDIWERLPKLQKVSATCDHGGDWAETEVIFYRTRVQYETCKGTEAKPDAAAEPIMECPSSTISGLGSSAEAVTEDNEAYASSYEDDDDW